MVYSKPLNTLVVLVLLSFANGDFTPLGHWLLRKDTIESMPYGIYDDITSSNPYILADTTTFTSLDNFIGCYSIGLSSQTWSLTTDTTSLIGTQPEYAFGFWVKFESTISTKVFQFGGSTGPHYIVSSTKDGALKVSFYSDATTTSSSNDIPITVPLSNFYTDKWIFIVFHFKKVSTVTLDIILPKTAMITKTSADFALPGGKFYFGMSIKAKFREVVLTKTATINGSYDTITLSDGSAPKIAAGPCSEPSKCSDDVCDTDSKCITISDYCTVCDDTNGCTSCDSNSNRSGAD